MEQWGVENFLRRLRTTVSIERAPDSGRLRTSRRLSACVDAEGGHFQHYLCLLLSK